MNDLFKMSIKLYENNHLIINNFKKLNDFDHRLIQVDYYKIEGKNLQIIIIDENRMEIYGAITKIEIMSI